MIYKFLLILVTPLNKAIKLCALDLTHYKIGELRSLFTLSNTLRLILLVILLGVTAYNYPYKLFFILSIVIYIYLTKRDTITIPYATKPLTLTPGLLAFFTFLPNTVSTASDLLNAYGCNELITITLVSTVVIVSLNALIFKINPFHIIKDKFYPSETLSNELINLSALANDPVNLTINDIEMVETEIENSPHLLSNGFLQLDADTLSKIIDVTNKATVSSIAILSVLEIPALKEQLKRDWIEDLQADTSLNNIKLVPLTEIFVHKEPPFSEIKLDKELSKYKTIFQNRPELNGAVYTDLRLTNTYAKVSQLLSGIDHADRKKYITNILLSNRHINDWPNILSYMLKPINELRTNYNNIFENPLEVPNYNNRIKVEHEKRINTLYYALKILWLKSPEKLNIAFSEKTLLGNANFLIYSEYDVIGQESRKLYQSNLYENFYKEPFYHCLNTTKTLFSDKQDKAFKLLQEPPIDIIPRKEFNQLDSLKKIDYHLNSGEAALREHLFTLAILKNNTGRLPELTLSLMLEATEDLIKKAHGIHPDYRRSYSHLSNTISSNARILFDKHYLIALERHSHLAKNLSIILESNEKERFSPDLTNLIKDMEVDLLVKSIKY